MNQDIEVLLQGPLQRIVQLEKEKAMLMLQVSQLQEQLKPAETGDTK